MPMENVGIPPLLGYFNALDNSEIRPIKCKPGESCILHTSDTRDCLYSPEKFPPRHPPLMPTDPRELVWALQPYRHYPGTIIPLQPHDVAFFARNNQRALVTTANSESLCPKCHDLQVKQWLQTAALEGWYQIKGPGFVGLERDAVAVHASIQQAGHEKSYRSAPLPYTHFAGRLLVTDGSYTLTSTPFNHSRRSSGSNKARRRSSQARKHSGHGQRRKSAVSRDEQVNVGGSASQTNQSRNMSTSTNSTQQSKSNKPNKSERSKSKKSKTKSHKAGSCKMFGQETFDYHAIVCQLLDENPPQPPQRMRRTQSYTEFRPLHPLWHGRGLSVDSWVRLAALDDSAAGVWDDNRVEKEDDDADDVGRNIEDEVRNEDGSNETPGVWPEDGACEDAQQVYAAGDNSWAELSSGSIDGATDASFVTAVHIDAETKPLLEAQGEAAEAVAKTEGGAQAEPPADPRPAVDRRHKNWVKKQRKKAAKARRQAEAQGYEGGTMPFRPSY